MSAPRGKKAVIVGGTHGIGMAAARALLDEGAAGVLLTGRGERNVEAARRELAGRPAAHVVRSDAASLVDIDALGARVESDFGNFDLLFFNAGLAVLEPFGRVTEDAYDRSFPVNTKGAFFTAQRLAPLVRDGGAIVFTTSAADETGTPGMSVYSAAKAAVRSFVRVLGCVVNQSDMLCSSDRDWGSRSCRWLAML